MSGRKHDWERYPDGSLRVHEIQLPEAPEENHHEDVQCVTCLRWSGCVHCQEETLEAEDCPGEAP